MELSNIFKLNMKKTILTLALLALPLVASAHVKWFATEHGAVRPYELSDWPVMAWLAIAIIVVLIGIYLEKVLKVPKWFEGFIERYAPYVLSICSIGFGLSFLLFSYNGFIFAPNLMSHGFTDPLLIIQAVAGLMMVFGFYERIGGLLLIVLFALGVQRYGFGEMMDTMEMLGFALYVMIVGRPKFKIVDIESLSKVRHEVHSYGLAILRAGTGLNLIILGFSEKILSPSMTADFLSKYDWNLMTKIGFESYNNYWFAFSAGAVEALFGVFFLLGLVTRLTTLCLAVFLVSTLILLGPVELVGHLPHFSIAMVLLLMGSGARLKLVK